MSRVWHFSAFHLEGLWKVKCFVIVVYSVNRKSSANVCPKLNYMFEIVNSHPVNPDTACMNVWHVQFLMPYYMGIVCYFLFLVSRTASSTRVSFPCREWSCHGSEVRKVSSVVQSAKVLTRANPDNWNIKVKNFFRALRGFIGATRLYSLPSAVAVPL